MTGPEYAAALSNLSLTPDQAATWLGIGRSTAYRYLKTGCEGAVERALTERIARLSDAACFAVSLDVLLGISKRIAEWGYGNHEVDWLREYISDHIAANHSDLTAAVGLPE